MLSKEDSRRLAQLERQLRRDDPEFCARMTAGRPAPKRSSFALVFVAVVVWTTALIFGVLAWWIAAGITAVFATTIVIALVFRLRPGGGRTFRPGAVPPGW